jgi:hypothetical protein
MNVFGMLPTVQKTPQQIAEEEEMVRQYRNFHPLSGPQGLDEPNIVAVPRQALGRGLDYVKKPFEAIAGAVGKAFETPRDVQEAAAARAPKPPAQARPQAFQQQGAAAAPWQPFANFATGAPGQMPGAPRDGGNRLHAANAQDFSGMKVGTPIVAPPMGAQLIGSGTGGNAGNWGKWQLADGRSMRVMHLTERPTAEVVGPGQPLAFIGNTGNASTKGTDRGVAHVETWDAKGKPIAPAAFFGQSAGPQMGPNQSRMQQAINAAGGMPAAPGPDMTGVNKHLSLLEQQKANIEKPYEFTYTPPDYPDRPAPEQLKDIDYTKADAAWAAATPKNPFGTTPEEQEKGQLKMRRASYWAGLGQAFANFKDGQGLGSLLANAGGAMLSGAMAGDERVRAKMEEYDKNLAAFKQQESGRETTKATNTANLVNQNINANNQHAGLMWSDKMKDLSKLDVQFTPDGRAVVGQDNPDGTRTFKSTMVNPAAVNGILEQMGLTHERASALKTRAEELEYQGELSMFKMMLPAAFADAMQSGDNKTAAETALTAAHIAAFEIVDGNTWRQVVSGLPNGQQVVAKLNNDAWTSVGIQTDQETGEPIFGQSPTKQQSDDYKNYIQNSIVNTFMETGNMYRLIGGPTKEVYTDQEGLPDTGVRSTKAPDPNVTSAIFGNRARDTTVTKRSSQKLPFGGSYSETRKED